MRRFVVFGDRGRRRSTAAAATVVAVVGLLVGTGTSGAATKRHGARVGVTTATATPCTPDAPYTQCLRFDYTGSDQTFDVPAVLTTGATLAGEGWGAGGGPRAAGRRGVPATTRRAG